MREAFPEAIVDVPDEMIKGVATLPDLGDSHVFAAAIVGKANVIVTQNTKHFPCDTLERYGILCHSADDFLIHQYHLGPDDILEKLDEQAADIKMEILCQLKLLEKAAPNFVKILTEKIK